MSQFVAIEIENDQVLVAAGKQRSGQVQITHAFSVGFGPDDNDEVIGHKLKEGLQKHGVSRSDAIAVVSRTSMEIRELTVPPAPLDELPELVRFKAKTDFGSFTDQWLLDYVPFEITPEQPINVLAAAISPEVKKQIQIVADIAGLRLKSVVFRPLAAMDLVRSRLSGKELRLIVDHTVGQTDLTIVRGTQLLAARTVRVPESYSADERANQISGEIRRTIASTRRRIGIKEIDQILVCGNQNAPVFQSLSQILDVDVEFAEPFEIAPTTSALSSNLPEQTGEFAALFGSLIQQFSGERHQLDFLNPRKKRERKSNRKRVMLYGSLAAAVFLFGSIFCWWTLSSQSSEIAALKSKLADKQQRNEGKKLGSKDIDQVTGEVGKIDEWVAEGYDWLEQLFVISDAYETPDDAIINSLTGRFRRGSPIVTVIGRSADVQAESTVKSNLKTYFPGVATKKSTPSGDETYTLNYEHQLDLATNRPELIKKIDTAAIEFIKDKSRFQNETNDNTDETE